MVIMTLCNKLIKELDEIYCRQDQIADTLLDMDSSKPLSARQGNELFQYVLKNKSNFIKKSEIKECIEKDIPIPGLNVEDRYIQFTLTDEKESLIFVKLSELQLDQVETVNNKTQSISVDSSEVEYPSAKAVYDYHDDTKADVVHIQQDSTINVTTNNYGNVTQEEFNSYLSYDMIVVKQELEGLDEALGDLL